MGALKFNRSQYQRDVALVGAATAKHYIDPPHSPYVPEKAKETSMRDILIGVIATIVVFGLGVATTLYVAGPTQNQDGENSTASPTFQSPDEPTKSAETMPTANNTATIEAAITADAIMAATKTAESNSAVAAAVKAAMADLSIETATTAPTPTNTETEVATTAPTPTNTEEVVSSSSPTATTTPKPTNTFTPVPTPTLSPSPTPTSVITAKGIPTPPLVVAVSKEAWPFSYQEGSNFKGFEVDLIKEIVRGWYGLEDDANPEARGVLKFVDTTVAEREPRIRYDGTPRPEREDYIEYEEPVHFLIGSVAYRAARCEPANSKGLICTRYSHANRDRFALLVQANGPFDTFCDLDFQSNIKARIRIIQNTTGESVLRDFERICKFEDITIELNDLDDWKVPSRPAAINAVKSSDDGRDVYRSNYYLLKYGADYNNFPEESREIFRAPESYFDTYHIWLRGEHAELRDLLDEALLAMRASGEYDKICGGEPYCHVETSHIGIAIDLSGRNSPLGKDQQKGADIAQSLFNRLGGINGRPIGTIRRDNTSDQSEQQNITIENFKALIDENVIAIVGPSLSQQAFTANKYVNEQIGCIPIIGPSNTAEGIPQLGDCILRISAPVARYAPYAVDVAFRRGVERVAVAYATDDAFSRSETVTFQKAVTDTYGLELVTVEAFETTDSDFSVQVENILDEKPELVIISGLQRDGTTFLTQLRESGYDGLIIGGNGLNTPRILPLCKQYCEGVLIAQAYSYELDTPINQQFIQEFQEHQDEFEYPPQFTAQLFSAIQVIVEALTIVDAQTPLEDMDITQQREALTKQLLSGMMFETPLGTISFDSEGEVHQNNFYVAEISDSQFKTIATYETD